MLISGLTVGNLVATKYRKVRCTPKSLVIVPLVPLTEQ